MSAARFGLSPAGLSAAFPFHIIVDPSLRIIQSGPSFSRVFPGAATGVLLADVAQPRRPQIDLDFEALKRASDTLIIWDIFESGITMRGGILRAGESDALVFLWSPWITDPSELLSLGFSVRDFAVYDPIFELLQVVDTHKMALADARELAARVEESYSALAEQNRRLSETQDALEKEQREARKLALIASRTDNAVVLTDAAGRIEWINEGFTRLTGYVHDEVVGRTPGSLLQGPDTDPAVVTLMRTRIANGEGFDAELVNYAKDGRRYWVTVEVQPMRNEAGEVVNFMAIESDITERKNADDALRASNEMAHAANRAKSEFLATMSHEIRTPMNGVLGMTELLLRTQLDEQQTQFAKSTQISATALLRILDDILDFSKIEAGRLEFERQPFDPWEVAEQVLAMEAPRAQSKGIELAGVPQLNLPAHVVGDSGRVRQVLLNLVSNAVKFTDRGFVCVHVNAGEISGGNVDVTWEVVDSGIGVAPDAQESLFEAFRQLDASPRRRHGGAGLGLAICRDLVRAMGGEITVDSTPEKGSRFRFTLPLAVATETRGHQLADTGRLLVIGGRQLATQSLGSMLDLAGATWEHAAGWAEADLAMARNEVHQLIVDEALADATAARFTTRRSLGLPIPKAILATHSLARITLIEPFSAALSPPVSFSGLVAALSQAPDTNPLAAASSLVDGGTRRVLVAEDDEISQSVATHMLEALGCEVTCVTNGLLALEALRTGTFAVVFLDCHMPEMDGYEAARRVRAGEEADRSRLSQPIVAMTAGALPNERERCLDAGMDDYLSKPVKLDDFQRVLTRFDTVEEQQEPRENLTLDEGFLSALGARGGRGSTEFIASLSKLFVESVPSRFEAIRLACTHRSCDAIRVGAHTLVGAARQLGADQLAAAALAMETAACRGDVAEAVAGLDELDRQCSAACDALRQRFNS